MTCTLKGLTQICYHLISVRFGVGCSLAPLPSQTLALDWWKVFLNSFGAIVEASFLQLSSCFKQKQSLLPRETFALLSSSKQTVFKRTCVVNSHRSVKSSPVKVWNRVVVPPEIVPVKWQLFETFGRQKSCGCHEPFCWLRSHYFSNNGSTCDCYDEHRSFRNRAL